MKVKRKSAGILLYKIQEEEFRFFLVHPGGPFWVNKDEGTWTIPKGEFKEDEEPLAAAKREFLEETGKAISGNCIELTPVLQKAGKMVYGWAIEGDIDANAITCNTYKIQWPPNSGQWKSFPEVDKGAWFTEAEARHKINQAQFAFIEELIQKLSGIKLL